MPGCYKNNKAKCDPPECNWIVGKGCKETSAAAPAVASLKNVLYLEKETKDILKQVHPSLGVAKQLNEWMNDVINAYLKARFRSFANINCTKNHLAKILFPAGDIAKHAAAEGLKAIDTPSIFAFEPEAFAQRLAFKNKTGKPIKFNSEAVSFMIGAMEYILAELLDMGGNVAIDKGKARVTVEHVKLAIQSDTELITLFKVDSPAKPAKPAKLAKPAKPYVFTNSDIDQLLDNLYGIKITKDAIDFINGFILSYISKRFAELSRKNYTEDDMEELFSKPGKKLGETAAIAGKEAVSEAMAIKAKLWVKNNNGENVSFTDSARCYVSGVLVMIVIDILSNAFDEAEDEISQKHVKLAIKKDRECLRIISDYVGK